MYDIPADLLLDSRRMIIRRPSLNDKGDAMKKVIVVLFLSVLIFSVDAIDENTYNTYYPGTVRPWFEHARVTGTLTAADGRILHWMAIETPHEKGAVVIVPGFTEQVESYVELLYDLRNEGYSFYLLDLRGQGLSQGDYPSRDRWYVKNWKSFLSDLELFYTKVVRAKPHPTTILYGYSMGGAIATVFAAEHPDAADRLILLNPMYRINSSPVPIFLMRLVAGTMTLFGGGTSYLPGYGPYEAHPFKNNPEHITSRVRYEERQRLARTTSAYRPGGITAKGGLELLALSAAALRATRKVTMPTLLIQSGKDQVVRNSAENRGAARMKNCTKFVLPDSGHLTMFEVDAVRNQAVDAVRAFLDYGSL